MGSSLPCGGSWGMSGTCLMVRRLEKRFKNILTMNIVFWRAVIAGDNATYGDKMRFSVTF